MASKDFRVIVEQPDGSFKEEVQQGFVGAPRIVFNNDQKKTFPLEGVSDPSAGGFTKMYGEGGRTEQYLGNVYPDGSVAKVRFWSGNAEFWNPVCPLQPEFSLPSGGTYTDVTLLYSSNNTWSSADDYTVVFDPKPRPSVSWTLGYGLFNTGTNSWAVTNYYDGALGLFLILHLGQVVAINAPPLGWYPIPFAQSWVAPTMLLSYPWSTGGFENSSNVGLIEYSNLETGLPEYSWDSYNQAVYFNTETPIFAANNERNWKVVKNSFYLYVDATAVSGSGGFPTDIYDSYGTILASFNPGYYSYVGWMPDGIQMHSGTPAEYSYNATLSGVTVTNAMVYESQADLDTNVAADLANSVTAIGGAAGLDFNLFFDFLKTPERKYLAIKLSRP